MAKGYIYILVNPAMQGMVKIGKSLRNSDDRAKELSAGTNIPFSFEVGYDKLVSDCDYAERLIHKKLSHLRSASNREFFSISLREAINACNKIILDNKLSLNEREVWDYQFNEETYSNLGELLKAFVENKKTWENGLVHIERNYIDKWLENTRSYDYLVLLERTKAKYNKETDKLLISLLFEINQDYGFKLLGRKIDQSFLIKLLELKHDEKDENHRFLLEQLEKGNLQKYYKIFKQIRSYSDYQLELFFTLYSKKFMKRHIRRVIHWKNKPEDYYINETNSNLDYEDARWLLSKDEIDHLENENYISEEILSMLRSTNKDRYFEILGQYDSYYINTCLGKRPATGIEHKLFEKAEIYWFSEIHFKDICKLNAREYIKLANLRINNISEYLKEYLFPESLREGLFSKSFEVFFFSVSLFKDTDKTIQEYAKTTNPLIKKILANYDVYKRNLINRIEELNNLLFKEKIRDTGNTVNILLISQVLRTQNYLDFNKRLRNILMNFFRSEHNGVKLIRKKGIEDLMEFAGDYFQPKSIDKKLFECKSLNFAAWFLQEYEIQRTVLLEEIDDLMIPKYIRNKLIQRSLTYTEYSELTKFFPIIFSKKYYEQIVIPLSINEKLLNNNKNIFIEGVRDLCKLSLYKKIINKKTLRHLVDHYYFPIDLKNEIICGNEESYNRIIDFLNESGFVFYDTYQRFLFDYKEKNDISVYINGIESTLFSWEEISILETNSEVKMLYNSFKNPNWVIKDDGFNKYLSIKTIHLADNAESWCIVKNYKSIKQNYLIKKTEIQEYETTWGTAVVENVLNRYYNLTDYKSLRKIIVRKIIPEKLEGFKKCIEKVSFLSQHKHYSLIDSLRSYHDSFYNDYGDRSFSNKDLLFINNIIDVTNSGIHLQINKIVKNWLILRIKKIADELGVNLK